MVGQQTSGTLHTNIETPNGSLRLSSGLFTGLSSEWAFPPEAATAIVANSLFLPPMAASWVEKEEATAETSLLYWALATIMGAAGIAPNADVGILDTTVKEHWIWPAGAAGAAVAHSVMVMVATGLGAVEIQAVAVTETSVPSCCCGCKSFSAMGGALVEREVEVEVRPVPVVADMTVAVCYYLQI